MQAYILTSTFYLIINVCGHWCQLVGRPSRVFWHWSRAPWVAAAHILPLQITQRHWRARVPLGRPRLGAAVAVAAPAHQCRSVRICDYHYCYTWVCIYIVYARWHSNCVFSGLNHATTLITKANSVHQIIIA